jgi:hypothetical protein
MFELLAVPHRVIPFVQMGFRVVSYISNLFSIDNSFFLDSNTFVGILAPDVFV